jgi:7-carboxy-7-deazaguanine synthase
MHPNIKSNSVTQKNTQAELRINEIFFSIQGESSKVGLPTIFIRLTGCPLRCSYCDTAYAFHDGNKMTVDDIIKDISQYCTKHVTVTGGEPLAQKSCNELLTRLSDEGFQVSLETSGAIDVAHVDERVMKVMDIKTPGSAEQSKNKFENIAHITAKDQVKFVIGDRPDYEWSKQKMSEFNLTEKCEVLFSPEHESVNPTDLANWILEDKLNVRLQVQLHKYLWGNVPGK